jgi:hypothetical protein
VLGIFPAKGEHMERKVYLYQRKNGIFYAEMIVEGHRIVRSTKETNRNKAAIAAAKWLAEGVTAQGKKPLSSIADYKALLQFVQTGDISEIQAVEINRALLRRGLITVMAGMIESLDNLEH